MMHDDINGTNDLELEVGRQLRHMVSFCTQLFLSSHAIFLQNYGSRMSEIMFQIANLTTWKLKHHSDQMSEGSQVPKVTIFVQYSKVAVIQLLTHQG